MAGSLSPPRCAAVIVAAGQGLRAGQGMPKQFAHWRGKPVVRHSAEALAGAGIAPVVVVIPADCEDVAAKVLEGIPGIRLAHGGPARQDSVRLGLEALEGDRPELVLIHDAARPVVPGPVVKRLIAALDTHRAAIPVLPVADSLAREAHGMMERAEDRETLRRVQTPQAFRFGAILAAHKAWTGAASAGDDAQVAQAAGIEVALVEGDEALHKLTYATDFSRDAPPVRVGSGYDVHRLADGEELWLCGIRIDHAQGLAGHSDADVAIHALVDALLGAIGAGDIGLHFPPSDPQWRGARSHRFLEHAVKLVSDAGYGVGNVDLTLICEAPKIGPHRDSMRESLAKILGIGSDLVSVKATTTERLGFTGRGEGIAAQAVAMLVRI
ncbi:MAG: bifunctional 2-C-methyl-D-erythritol 4-phosphate cytidylyltransferase/2-C-methyl-D-erythritol 2,4-cyclodiphosphate synthase [Novosphingobium sp.]